MYLSRFEFVTKTKGMDSTCAISLLADNETVLCIITAIIADKTLCVTILAFFFLVFIQNFLVCIPCAASPVATMTLSQCCALCSRRVRCLASLIAMGIIILFEQP